MDRGSHRAASIRLHVARADFRTAPGSYLFHVGNFFAPVIGIAAYTMLNRPLARHRPSRGTGRLPDMLLHPPTQSHRMTPDRIPVPNVAGFLGSGKPTSSANWFRAREGMEPVVFHRSAIQANCIQTLLSASD